jgi:hypothetical protein
MNQLTKKAIKEVCLWTDEDGKLTDTGTEIDWLDCTYYVNLFSTLLKMPLAYSPLWTKFYDEWDYWHGNKTSVEQSLNMFFEHTQGMGRDRHERVLTNYYNAYINGSDDSTKHFEESEYFSYIVFENKSQLPGNWILIIHSDKTRAFYCTYGEEVIAALQAALLMKCNACDNLVENYTTNYEFPWTPDQIVYQEEEESLRPDYEECSEDQLLLPGMPEPAHNRPAPKWRIDPEELEYWGGDEDDYLLLIHGRGPVCPRCKHGILEVL